MRFGWGKMKEARLLLLTLAGLMLGIISIASAQTDAAPAVVAVKTPSQAIGTLAPRPAATQKTPSAGEEKPVASSTARLTGLNDQGLAKVFRVQVDYGEGGEAFVDISTTNTVVYQILNLKSPPRLVVDIHNARAENLKRVYPAHSAVLKDLRTGQFRDTVVRIVADLSGEPIPDVYPEPGGLRIALQPALSSSRDSGSEVRGSSKVAVQLESPPPQAAVATHPNSESQTLSHPLAAKVSSRSVERGVRPPPVAATAAAPPVLTSRPLPASETRRAVELAAPAAELRTVPVALTGNPDAPWLRATARPEPPQSPLPAISGAERAARVLAADAQASGGGSQAKGVNGASAQVRPRYTGEPISVNLKDVDLTDFFRLIHEVSGLNIMVDPSVTGKVTLVLDSVPWDQALDIVLSSNGLGRTLEGNVLRIAKIETLTGEEDAAAKLNESRLEAGPLVTEVRHLKYARALDTPASQAAGAGGPVPQLTPGVVTILKGLAGVLSKRGTVVADPRDNAVIMADVVPQIPIIEAVIDKLDMKPKQISIEARVVQANSDFTRSLGTALAAAVLNKSGSTLLSGVTGSNATGFTGPNTPHPTPITLTSAVTGFGVFAISNASARYVINAAIEAAESRDQAKIISAPSIVTQDNMPGEVMQGTQIPIQTTINNTISVQFVNATLTLDVTPQVTAEGNIFMVIKVQNSSPGAILPNAPGPEINTQSATTQVLVPDGGTVVFGGVKVTTRTRAANQVPVLGSVPVLGNLFKSKNSNDQDQELLFFVAPKVLPG